MAEKTLYTALGHFRCRNDGGGRRYPVIPMDHREFGMDPQEMTLWTALCWRLTDQHSVQRTSMNSSPTEWSFSLGAAFQTALTDS